jgi:hypothetical protein
VNAKMFPPFHRTSPSCKVASLADVDLLPLSLMLKIILLLQFRWWGCHRLTIPHPFQIRDFFDAEQMLARSAYLFISAGCIRCMCCIRQACYAGRSRCWHVRVSGQFVAKLRRTRLGTCDIIGTYEILSYMPSSTQ